jgi:hypothetical protein
MVIDIEVNIFRYTHSILVISLNNQMVTIIWARQLGLWHSQCMDLKKKMFQSTNQIRWLYHVEHIGLYHNIHNMVKIDIEVNIFRYTHSILVISFWKYG